MAELLQSLIAASEKASNIARACRTKQELFTLLVQEKGTKDANPRFVRDFKTLADVLIQETVRHDIGKKFPELMEHIHGEENNTFSNTLGETITVQVKETEVETAELLCKVLDGDKKAAELLATEVHRDIAMDDINSQISGCLNLDLPVGDMGVWIDPIDSTAEYINGDNEAVSVGSISLSGLQCVTVLIGVFHRHTGQPVIGVLNQPFHNESKGRCLWGISYMGKRIFFNPFKDSTEQQNESGSTCTICISSSENVIIKELLNEAGYNLVESSGAGYKLLMVILGYVDAYILSRPSTYKWDTCGPHAILNSLNGGILDFNIALNEASENDNCEITYFADNKGKDNVKIDEWCNKGGIIAYRNTDLVSKVLDVLTPP